MNQKDICDIIIENAIKDWKYSMNNKIKREQWGNTKIFKVRNK